jgi:RNA polymerase sigma-70 factor (ECF subfamily)
MTTLEDLYRRYSKDVFRFAFWLSGDRAEAEDITSETFVRAWAGADDLRLSTVKAYLIAIARNQYLHRRRRAVRECELDPGLPDPAPGPDREVERRRELQAVLEQIQALPELDRAALLMHADLELPYEEIARVLGLSLGAVKVRVHRARLRLARACHREGD